MKSWFLIPLIIVVLGVAAYVLYNNPAVKMQVMNLIPQSGTAANLPYGTVEIKNFSFSPKTITIRAGESVTLVNKDSVTHTATADDGTWDSGPIASGESKSVSFRNPGTYAYHCSIHPSMTATIVVTQ